MPKAPKRCILGLITCWNLNKLVSVAVGPPKVAETSTKLSPVPLQKHSPGGCAIDMAPSNNRRQGYIVLPGDILFCVSFSCLQLQLSITLPAGSFTTDTTRHDTARRRYTGHTTLTNPPTRDKPPGTKCFHKISITYKSPVAFNIFLW